jgi:hypothetical protein
MDVMNIVDGAISFTKDGIDKVMKFWDGLEEDRKKLLIGCVCVTVAVIAVASIAYSLGKAKGRRQLVEEEDF